MGLDDFRVHLRAFTSTHDVDLHNESILALLDPLDLDIEYKKLVSEGGISRVMDIFASFADTQDDEELGDFERKSLEQVGDLTKKYFEERAYSAFAEMIFALTIESLAEKYDVSVAEFRPLMPQEREMIYSHISEEIYLQTFLLENMSQRALFDWNRDPIIIERSLMVLTVCFSDIYAFLTEDEVDEMAD